MPPLLYSPIISALHVWVISNPGGSQLQNREVTAVTSTSTTGPLLGMASRMGEQYS
jgi:hypothetical protein